MDFIEVRTILKLLLMKKHTTNVEQDELRLLEELQVLLLSNDNKKNGLECYCEINHDTLEIEIENNQCSNCGLPLCV